MALTMQQRLTDAIRILEDVKDELAGGPVTELPKSPPAAEGAPRLAVVVGHTRESQGAGAGPPISASEYVWNTDLAARMKAHATTVGLALEIFMRDAGGIAVAYARAGAWKPGAVMELHFNSAADVNASGTVTLVAEKATAASKTFAKAVQAGMVGALGLRDRGVATPWQGRGEGSLTALPAVPSILIEPYFGSSAADCKVAHERKQALAEALVDAASDYLRGLTQ